MLKGLGDIGNLMRIQKELKNVQKRIAGTVLDGLSQDGMITAKVSGEYKLMGISINDELIRGGDGSRLEKMVVSAVNDAVEKVKSFSADEMKKLTGGLDIPGLGSFFRQ